jgi:GH15 family glucan-1,4-alpha-glucosidase
LPEIPGGSANWDYRFTWLRDTSLLIDTLFRIGYSGEAKAFLNFVVRQAQSGAAGQEKPLGPVYAIRGGEVPADQELAHLSGYNGARPVRTGNRARNQFQLDTFAHVLEAFFYFRHTGGKLDRAMKKLIAETTDTLLKRWQEPDNGVWESVERRPYTYGKVMAWTGLAAVADVLRKRRSELEKTCEQIRREVFSSGLKTQGALRYLAAMNEDEEADASALLGFTTNFLPIDLARATRERIEQKLGDGAFLYRNEKQRSAGEGAFLLCSFWLINHLIKEGDLNRAESLLQDMISRLSSLGLFSEEIEVSSGDFLGNYPQAFSHLGLIGAILNLDLARKNPAYARLPDHEKFQRTVGPTIGVRGVIAGFFRVPKTFRLLFSSRSKWR